MRVGQQAVQRESKGWFTRRRWNQHRESCVSDTTQTKLEWNWSLFQHCVAASAGTPAAPPGTPGHLPEREGGMGGREGGRKREGGREREEVRVGGGGR